MARFDEEGEVGSRLLSQIADPQSAILRRKQLFKAVYQRVLGHITSTDEVGAELEDAALAFFWGHRDLPHASDSAAMGAALGRLSEWFALERASRASGSRPVERYLETCTSESELHWVETLRAGRLGVYRVTRVETDIGLEVEDLWRGETLVVPELRGTRTIERADIIAGRLYPLAGEYWCLSPVTMWVRDESIAATLRNLPQGERTQRHVELALLGDRGAAPAPETLEGEALIRRIRVALDAAGGIGNVRDLRSLLARCEDPSATIARFVDALDVAGPVHRDELLRLLGNLAKRTPRLV